MLERRLQLSNETIYIEILKSLKKTRESHGINLKNNHFYQVSIEFVIAVLNSHKMITNSSSKL